eukprot:2558299-Amphidinium_carterae.1
MKDAGAIKPVMFVEYACYDETKMRVKVQWRGAETKDVELSNVFVVISKWAMLLERVESRP